jgi:hypothetical protein
MSKNSRIWLVVIAIHVIGGFFLTTTSFREKPIEKKLVVVTRQLASQAPKIVTANIVPKLEKKNTPIPIKKVAPKKPAKTPTKSSKQVLKKIDHRTPKKYSAPTPTPQAETPPSHYIDIACHVFQNELSLPEKGEVKLTITVQPNGKIVKIEEISFESKINLDYLMTVLPTLSLPIPERGKDVLFTIVFCND